MSVSVHRTEQLYPWSLNFPGWRRVLPGVVKEIIRDQVTLIAGGVAFFGFLAIFPAMAAIVAAYGLVFDASDVANQITGARGILPSAALELLEEQLHRLISADSGSLSLGAVLGLLLALWSANKGSRGIVMAINMAYDEKEDRNFISLNLVSFILTVGIIGAVLIMVGMVAVVPAWLSWAGLSVDTERWLALARWPVLLTMLLLGSSAVYYLAPNRRFARWQWLTPGAVFFTFSMLAVSGLFSLYVQSFGNYDDVYGSLGAAVVFLLWLYLGSFLALLGGELNAAVEREVAVCRTVGSPRPKETKIARTAAQ